MFYTVLHPVKSIFCLSLEVRLYMLILEKLEKYEEALEFLKGPLGGGLFTFLL